MIFFFQELNSNKYNITSPLEENEVKKKVQRTNMAKDWVIFMKILPDNYQHRSV